MALKNIVSKKPKADSVMGVDCSSQKVAFGIVNEKGLQIYGCVHLDGADSLDRTIDAARKMGAVLAMFDVEFAAVESAVVVNNKSTVIKLAYVYGAVIGALGVNGIKVDLVAPISWQSHIGNPLWTRSERDAVYKKHKSKSQAKSELRDMRKQRTKDKMLERFGYAIADDDVADAVGIAAYAWDKMTRR